MSRIYLELPDILEIHRQLIDEFGGSKGLREPGALESALMRPQMGYYQDLIQEAAALMESLAMNHPFIDGNKRIALAATDVFLRINGYFIDCKSLETHKMFMEMFENRTFTFQALEKWLRVHVKPHKNPPRKSDRGLVVTHPSLSFCASIASFNCQFFMPIFCTNASWSFFWVTVSIACNKSRRSNSRYWGASRWSTSDFIIKCRSSSATVLSASR